jgi:hypothetical protein
MRFLDSSFVKGNKPVQSLIASQFIPWLPLALAVFLWVYSLPLFDISAMGDTGLISIFPISLIIAYLILLFGFAGLFIRSRVNEVLFAIYVLVLILMIHGTPQLLYGTLRYSWAWKHVGIVDYIIRHGAVDPKIAILGVYHNWPGFFSLNALMTQLAGFPGAQVYAGWGPAFYEILFALGARSLFKIFTPSRKLQWLGVWMFVLTNWVGQDYFSPQATAYFVHLGILVLIFQYFGPLQAISFNFWKNRISSKFSISKYFNSLIDWVASLKLPQMSAEMELTRPHRLALAALILICFAMIVSSHQLTPQMSIVCVLVLTAWRYNRWKTLSVWMALFIVFWLLFPARTYEKDAIQSVIDSYGQVTTNIDSGLVDVTEISPGQVIVSWVGRGQTVLAMALAVLGFLKRVRYRYLDLPVVLLVIAPVLILFVSAYGGEVIFRVYFFVVPFLAFWIAGLFLPKDTRAKLAWWRLFLIFGASLTFLIGTFYSYYGKERQYHFTREEVSAAEYLYSHAVPNSLLIEGSRNYPSQFLNYEYFTYVAIDREPFESSSDFLANPAAVFYRWMSNPDYAASYLILTRGQKASVDAFARPIPAGSLDHIETELEKSDVFEIVYSNQDAIIFKIKPGK